MDYLHTDNVDVIPWPAFLLDLSTIEHMWNQMGRQISRRVPMPHNRI